MTSITRKKSKISEPASTAGTMNRRELIRSFSLTCAGLLSVNTLAGGALIAREPGGPVRKGQILSEGQMALLRELVELIIPQTETPGAAETDAHGFIDDQLANCQAPDEAERFIAELDRAGEWVRNRWGADLSGLSTSQKQEAMTALALKQPPFESVQEDFFIHLRALTVLAYYYSQAGASQELVYLPIPGGYRGDFKVSDNGGKSFSPHVF